MSWHAFSRRAMADLLLHHPSTAAKVLLRTALKTPRREVKRFLQGLAVGGVAGYGMYQVGRARNARAEKKQVERYLQENRT